ncbi:Gfo/Idh/MocA family protein [Microbacterium rhizomatis]|uniref:Gfo/Idh/MocA family protein n=1 Tax=Microbacterium rhizomatis TaxID=1631477 RepID=UPI001478E4EF|nr:Gfo/Idh/MocA family oxidoreductase [Microbacterium rhizomatis]
MSTTPKLRVGIAGAVRGGGFIAGLREESDRAELVAVYDPIAASREAFAATNDVAVVCESFEHLLDHVDLVILASPQQHHTPQAIAALARDIHVLSEVPAAVSLDQATALVAAVRRSNAQYMMSENYGYIRENLIVREMVREGALGDLYYGEGEYLHEMKSWHTTPAGDPTWRHFWQVGRDGITYPTHSLGPLLQWFDDRVISVSCVGTGRHTDPEHELQDTTILLARTAKGRLLRLRFDLLSNRPELYAYYSVQGTGGAYEAARTVNSEAVVYLNGRSPEGVWEPLAKYADLYMPHRYKLGGSADTHWGSDAWPIRDFIESIVTGTRPEIDVYAALDMTLPGLLSEYSIAQNGAWVHVPNPRFFTAGIGVDPSRESPLA